MTVYYPSGKRRSFIPDVSHRNICRAIHRNVNVEKIIVDIVSKTHPELITAAAAGIVSTECEAICKRGSGTILQNQSFSGIFEFQWDEFHNELLLKAPNTLKIVSSTFSSIPLTPEDKKFNQLLFTMGNVLHGRSQEMSSLHYQIALLLTHGACKQKDIERIAKLGLTVSPRSVQSKLASWEEFLDKEVIKLKDAWEQGEKDTLKFQIVGDNWDKNIIPSYRTCQDKTISLHLFQVVAVVDRMVQEDSVVTLEEKRLSVANFIPSLEEQRQLKEELSFLVAQSVIEHLDVLDDYEKIFPQHLEHEYSHLAGEKTKQFPLGLFDCNENKTQDVIRLMKKLTTKFVPLAENGDVKDEVFFGGDRLTDERVQSAQQAMANAATPKDKLQGFISKIEDWHRMMNFMEAIYKLTYSSHSQTDRGTLCFFRNMLNARNVKGEVKNAFRAYKMLYYTVFDACCCILFMKQLDAKTSDEVQLPAEFPKMTKDEKIDWLMRVCGDVVDRWIFEGADDMFKELRDILEDPDHPENYWVLNDEGRFACHFCEKSYCHSGSLKTHELQQHQHSGPKLKRKKKTSAATKDDELYNYILLVFKLTALLKNLDTAIDMADGRRAVRSAKYELPVFNKTNKLKYVIGCVHLTALSEETLSKEQRGRLIFNRTVNLQGGKNNNLALDEYIEMLNRDSKDIVSGHQTKESIIAHSKAYPHLINYTKHFDIITKLRKRKGFHKLPKYKEDVGKVMKELLDIDAFHQTAKRKFACRELSYERNPFNASYIGLSTMINRHRPTEPFKRLRDKHH